ncbi:MAG: helix-turn-helix transcriptional regulator [Rubrivivax sp.]
MAREVGTSQNKLKAVFKAAFGVTMAEYCLEQRIRGAQQLLLEAALTIAQVAERVGYEHQSSFTAAFRGHVGMSPREYRRHRAPFNLPLEGPPAPARRDGFGRERPGRWEFARNRSDRLSFVQRRTPAAGGPPMLRPPCPEQGHPSRGAPS